MLLLLLLLPPPPVGGNPPGQFRFGHGSGRSVRLTERKRQAPYSLKVGRGVGGDEVEEGEGGGAASLLSESTAR